MRAMFLCCVLVTAAATAVAAQDLPPPGAGPQRAGGGAGSRLFISPMGEPFRSEKGGAEPQNLWFDQADANHDKALTRIEFQADAARFFAVLDRKHDGEIDPDDIDIYETQMAPEIRVGAGGYDAPPAGEGDNAASQPVYPERQGAARYGYFSFPEPVMSADRNFNRGVTQQEFATAADARFDSLDPNHDGRVDRDELPRIAPPRVERFDGRGSGRGGGHRDGGGGRRDGSGERSMPQER